MDRDFESAGMILQTITCRTCNGKVRLYLAPPAKAIATQERCTDCEDRSVAGVYGADNPWVKWLAEHAPAELKKSPRELRQRQGVPATPTPGIPGSFIE